VPPSARQQHRVYLGVIGHERVVPVQVRDRPECHIARALRKRVLMAADSSTARPRVVRRFTVQRWSVPLALAASLTFVAVGTWQFTRAGAARETLTSEVLGSHVRSLMPGHLTDVLSTAQHTVKPWFNGKLDYSPPVYDFAGRGYPLLGGRLDCVGGRAPRWCMAGASTSSMCFCGQPRLARQAAHQSVRARANHLLHWTTGDYAYRAVSDLGLPELEDFASLLRKADTAANPPN
jgi:anti-sigma factor RsiW